LKDKFGSHKPTKRRGSKQRAATTPLTDPDFAALDASLVEEPVVEEIEGILPGDEDFEEDEDEDNEQQDRDMFDVLDDDSGDVAPLYVLPLYSSLGAKHQAKVRAITSFAFLAASQQVPHAKLETA
jgi:hypothetical protein